MVFKMKTRQKQQQQQHHHTQSVTVQTIWVWGKWTQLKWFKRIPGTSLASTVLIWLREPGGIFHNTKQKEYTDKAEVVQKCLRANEWTSAVACCDVFFFILSFEWHLSVPHSCVFSSPDHLSQCDSLEATPRYNKNLTQPGSVGRHQPFFLGGAGCCNCLFVWVTWSEVGGVC